MPTLVHPQRQRPGTCSSGGAGVDRKARIQNPLHQTRQHVAERLQREFPQPVPGRVFEPGSLRIGAGGQSARQRLPMALPVMNAQIHRWTTRRRQSMRRAQSTNLIGLRASKPRAARRGRRSGEQDSQCHHHSGNHQQPTKPKIQKTLQRVDQSSGVGHANFLVQTSLWTGLGFQKIGRDRSVASSAHLSSFLSGFSDSLLLSFPLFPLTLRG
jgi:hypothetical protein